MHSSKHSIEFSFAPWHTLLVQYSAHLWTGGSFPWIMHPDIDMPLFHLMGLYEICLSMLLMCKSEDQWTYFNINALH